MGVKDMKKRPCKTVTMQDIARKVGCSVNTVSLALRDSKRISQARREQIHHVSRKLGFVPNLAARSLVSSKSGIIGVYTRALYDAVRVELVDSLLSSLHQLNYKPVLGLGKGHKGPWHESPWMKSFQALSVDLIIVVAEEYGRIPRWNINVPTIFVGCQPAPSLKCDYMALDRREAGRQGVEHLLDLGHEHILLVCDESSKDFRHGCLKTLTKAQRKPNYFEYKDKKSLESVVQRIRGRRNKISAVIFGDSCMAASFMVQAQRIGIRIPEDIAVVGYDYLPWADMLRVPLTTIEQPIEELAVEATRLAERRLANAAISPVQMILEHRLVKRAST